MTTNTFVQSLKNTISERWIAMTALLLLSMGVLLFGGALIMSSLSTQRVKDGSTVTLNYILTLEDGTIYDRSNPNQPMRFGMGEGSTLQGFEDAIVGMQVGEIKTFELLPEQAYGPYHPELVGVFSRSMLKEGLEPEVGKPLTATGKDGSQITVLVTELTEDAVTVDANPPLAGHKLTFEVEIVSIEGNTALRKLWNSDYLIWLIFIFGGLISGVVLIFHKRGWRLRRV